MDIAKLPPSSASTVLFIALLALGVVLALSKKHTLAEYITRLCLILSLVILFVEQTWFAGAIVLTTMVLLVLRKGTKESRVPYVIFATFIGTSVSYFKFFS